MSCVAKIAATASERIAYREPEEIVFIKHYINIRPPRLRVAIRLESNPVQPRSEPTTLSGHLTVATLLGTACGLLDAFSLRIPLFTTDRVHFTPIRIWLLAPLVWLLYLVIVALGTHLLRLRRWAFPLLFLAGPGALVATRLLIATRFVFFGRRVVIPLAVWALVMLPLAFLARRLDGRLRPGRFATGSAIVLTLLIVTLLGALTLLRPRPATPAVSAAAGAPNVILIFLDTFRGDTLGHAPNLLRFGATGRRYDHAFAPYSWTLPSHLSVMTGFGPEQLEIDFDRQTYYGDRPTLAEAFHRRGYETAAILANPYLNPTTGMSRGFDTFDYSKADLDLCRTSFGFVVKAMPNARVPVCRMDAEEITDRALTRFRRARKPLFLTINYFDAHLPYYVPSKYRHEGYRAFQPLVEYPLVDRALRRNVEVSADVNDHLRQNYLLSVRYLDDELGRLLTSLRATPEGRDAIIAIVGDHGEQFGEHGLTMHANSVYRQVLHVPLLISGRGFAPAVIGEPATITDLYATLLAAAGIAPRRPMPRLPGPGETGAPVIGSYRAPRGVTGLPPRLAIDAWSVVHGRYHYIRYANGVEELYDLVADPGELRNLRDDPAAQATRAQLNAIAVKLKVPDGHDTDGKSQLFSIGYMQ